MLLDEFVETKKKELDSTSSQDDNNETNQAISDELDEGEARDIESMISQWDKDFDKLN